MTDTDATDTVQNRSEIIFVYDAEDTNPNGNPLSSNDRPRVDERTEQAVVTDVRLKRYLRDQLDDDGFGIYVRNPSKAPYEGAIGRDDLFKQVTDLDEDDIEDMGGPEAAAAFLENAADVRYFGATCSFPQEFQEKLGDGFPGQFIGPLQYEHARSLNQVVPKNESKQLSTVVSSGGDAEQGTFAEDNRLEYALISFHGVLNEVGAEATQLTEADAERLDSLHWRALKNQTLTRSKMGHQPRLYLRVEYETDEYHNGTLDDGLELDERSKADTELRNITDLVLNADQLLAQLEADSEHIATVHVKADDHLEFGVGEETTDSEGFYEHLRDVVGDDRVDVIDVYGTDE